MRWVAIAFGLMSTVSCGPTAATSGTEVISTEQDGPAATAEPDAEAGEEDPLEWIEVAPGIHAALQPARRRFSDSNAVVLASDAGLVVIDGPQSVVATRWLHGRAQSLPAGARRGVVTTHWHLDHSLGSTVLRSSFEQDGVAVEHWGHADLVAQLRKGGAEQLAEHRDALPGIVERGEAMRSSGARADGTPLTEEEQAQVREELEALTRQHDVVRALTLAEPNRRVREPTRVELGSLAFVVIPVQAHTDADVVVHVPAAKVLITGDVLDEIPFGGHGRPRRWLGVLEQLRGLGAETIVPGHGGLMEPAAFDRAIALWTAIVEQADLAVAQGETAEQRYTAWTQTEGFEQLRNALATDPVGGRVFDAFVPESLARAMAEARGEI